MDRKKFLKSAAALTLVSGLSFPASAEQIELDIFDTNGQPDWVRIRKNFKIHKQITYLNNGTIGVVPDFINKEIYKQFEYNAYRCAYPAYAEMENLRKSISSVVGTDYKNIAITKNVTEGINIACWGIDLKAGDEVLMTKHEHAGGCLPWIYRANTEGIVIKTFDLASTSEETLSNFKKAITPKTKVTAIPHIPCSIGQILPVKEMCNYARGLGIITAVDGAHPLGMIQFNIDDIGCDYYSGCLHKWLLGPVGVGFFYVNPAILNKTKIKNIGAYSLDKFDMTLEKPTIGELVNEAQRFSPGTFCGPLYNASIKSIEWYKSIGIENIERRVKALGKYTQDRLGEFSKDIEVLTPSEDISRAAQTAITFKNAKHSGAEFNSFVRMTPYNVIVRHVHEAGLNAVRISTHYYNSEKDIDKLIKAIIAYLAK